MPGRFVFRFFSQGRFVFRFFLIRHEKFIRKDIEGTTKLLRSDLVQENTKLGHLCCVVNAVFCSPFIWRRLHECPWKEVAVLLVALTCKPSSPIRTPVKFTRSPRDTSVDVGVDTDDGVWPSASSAFTGHSGCKRNCMASLKAFSAVLDIEKDVLRKACKIYKLSFPAMRCD